ncbi:sigma-70 family RNA polymerase sigma factor [Hymenobacter sp. GOD-10R]|uniref:sigma-70 family RNA polymerase sigma factor n=1 Tax=Hymenobacter sp. GOD-10R TaxID=3093922 RepID=UPI002D76D1FA|nr:sigma-70 family RNA polymerase sigma factor [Hymenobacter sp. GOD-10R]WRQ31073.1 sigma-70 family RNA polymerase sigma factor [Hymenobacter sp. GOD-10R]
MSDSTVLPTQPNEAPTTPVDSEMLIRLAFESDPRAGCELLYRHYYQALCSHAIRFVYSKSIAEDLVSDILCQFYGKGTYKDIVTSYRAFLYQSVRNRAYNYLRLEANRAVELDPVYERNLEATSQQPDSILEYEELCREVEAVIQSLPAKCRNIYLMHRFDEKKYTQIAEELQLSARTVEAQIRKASQLVKKALIKYWVLMAVLLLQG